ncbi:MAG: hypothetical protein EAY77_06015 [Flavobacteriia bacterium]|nr:MAG: hypothetical protein EAY77_06015 [Flavobacteriia bacterium]
MFKNKKLFLVLSSSVLLYWFLSKTIDVYQITIFGVLYEILWFPMLVFLFFLPILNAYTIFKNKNNLIPYFSLALNIITIVIVFLV